jgi:AraC-like DNA-binding protein/ligand-binding sensor domain-containing protein
LGNGGGEAYLFSKIDYQQGLSNSAVLCLFQERSGVMWFGTYDGMNCYDSRNMEVYRSDFRANGTLSNNIIHSIGQADGRNLWVTTHLGVNRFSLDSRRVTRNDYEFSGNYYLYSNSRGNTWVINETGVYYYDVPRQRFVKVPGVPSLFSDDMDRRAFVADDGSLWQFLPHTGKLRRFSPECFSAADPHEGVTVTTTDFHPKAIANCFYQNGIVCFVDQAQDLYMYDIARHSQLFIRNIGALAGHYGAITGITPFGNDIMLAFRTNGLVRLRASERYKEEVVDRNIRIYALYLDTRQDILWVASDGQGAVTYARPYSIADNLLLNQLSPNLSRQVRSIMADRYGGLWMGTKGDGLLHLPHYAGKVVADQAEIYSAEGRQKLSAYTKHDREFSVYTLRQSRYHDGFWVGSGAHGLLYYSFADKALRPVTESPGYQGSPITDVHGIYEASDSVLYVATGASGLHRVVVRVERNAIRMERHRQYHFYDKGHEAQVFYAMVAEGDSLLWLGSRGAGLVEFHPADGHYRVVSLKEGNYRFTDDVLSLCRTHDGHLCVGTTSGLVCLPRPPYRQGKGDTICYVGREQGLLNDMIHGVLEDRSGFLWLGTNRGLIKYNPTNGSSHAYYYTSGVQVGEFSDDAYYRSPYTGQLFFGGVNGALYLDNEGRQPATTPPDILLRRLSVDHTTVDISHYYAADGRTLHLRGGEFSSFTLSYVVPDFLTGTDVEYSYLLDGYNRQWSTFSSANEATFTSAVPPGRYEFRVRYKKDVFDTDYRYLSLPIIISAPWQRSAVAYLAYTLLLLALAFYVGYLLHRYVAQKRAMNKLLADNEQYARQLTQLHLMQEGLHDTPMGESAGGDTPGEADFTHQLLQIIGQNLDDEKLGSTLIAERMGLSRRQLYRKFKEASADGTTLGDLIKSYRLEKAAQLLLTEKLSVQEVMSQVGISSRSYFYREFTTRFGCPPGEYRHTSR